MSEADEKPRMSSNVRTLAEAARKRLGKNRSTGPLHVNRDARFGFFESPFSAEDDELWLYLLLDCFGTRLPRVAGAFMQQLQLICPNEFDRETGNRPDHGWMEQALSIVCSLKPRDESEAASAAQAVALHFTAMKIGKQIGSQSYVVDPKSASALARVSKAYSDQVQTLKDLQGSGRSKRQVIKVQKNVVIINRDEKHLHVSPSGGGGGNGDGQPHEQDPQRARARDAGDDAPIIEGVATLRREDTGGNVVPLPGSEGTQALPQARRRGRIGRAAG